MKKRTSSRPRPNPLDLLKKLQFHSIVAYAEERQQEIFVDWLEKDKEDLRAALRYESAILDEASDFLHTDEARYAILRLGSLLGTVESFERVLYEQGQDQWVQARFQKEIPRAKHLPEVVRALETHGSMSHTELCKRLGLNPPTLTEAMKKVLETGAVQASPAGKYKIYTLTDSGLRYGREMRKNKWGENSLNEAFQTIEERVKNTSSKDETEHILSRLRAMLDERPSVKVHVGDTLDLRYSTYDQGVTSAEFTISAIPLENTPTQKIPLGGVMKPKIPKKQNIRRFINNELSEERIRA